MGQHRRILIVEDEILIRMFLHDLFAEAGWEVLEAGGADDALLIFNNTIDAVISDVEMPGTLDGLELCWQIHQRAPGTPMVLMSGRRLPMKSALPPKTRFFAKPVMSAELIEAITELLE